MLVFHSAWYLLLLGLLPLIWWTSFRSLSGLGRWRRWLAIGLRSLVVVLLVCALAEIQYQRTNDRITVMYLVDQSLSIPEQRRTEMIRYVNASIGAQRNDDKQDRAGVIVFAHNAEVEVPPVDFDVQLPPRIESLLDTQHTDLTGAMQRARAVFPPDGAKRIVLVTDGNENIGDVLAHARTLSDASIGIDVLPVPLTNRADVMVEKIALPVDVRRGQPFEIRVVLSRMTAGGAGAGPPTAGRVRIVRKAGEREDTLFETAVEIGPRKKVLSFREEIDQPDFYTYEARFIPDDPVDDAHSQNNLATAFTHVRGKGQVLLIENWEHSGEFDFLVDRLREEGLEIVVQPSNRLFTSLPELQRYDTVILADVPRSSGFDASNVVSFSNEQIRMLVRNTEELGCGLIMLGGPNSFGAGGWTNTELEQAMPVEFQIQATKVVAVGALALVIDRSGSMSGPKLQMSKEAAIAAVKTLSRQDYIAVVAFDTAAYPAVRLQRVGDYNGVARRIERIAEGGGTDMYPGMEAAYAELRDAPASAKHMIVLSDGQTPPNDFTKLASEMRQRDITVSAVAVGPDADRTLMSEIAKSGGGMFYAVSDPRMIPRIFMNEARRVARPLVYEPTPPVHPQVTTRHEIVQGVESTLPLVSGFVLTRLKQNPLVEQIIVSPKPDETENATILASWTYGLGKAVAFTADAGQRWTSAWTSWPQYDRFFSQMVRWSMRPTGDSGNFIVSTDVEGSRTRVIITALDKNDEFLNYQAMSGSVLGPGMESIPLDIGQAAPGRYVGEFDSPDSGSYLIMVTPGAGQAMIRTGVNIGYSAEFRDREANLPLLESLAKLSAKDGSPGKLMEPLDTVPNARDDEPFAKLLAVDPYRRDLPLAITRQDIWPWVVLVGSCLFLADVFVRRVQVSLQWLSPLWLWMTGILGRRRQPVAAVETMSRLQSRKAEVGLSLDSRRAAARFEPGTGTTASETTKQPLPTKPSPTGTPQASAQQPIAEQPSEDSYTSRLLKAKKQVWKDREKE
jgi:Mg-chelatase subunit ChlD